MQQSVIMLFAAMDAQTFRVMVIRDASGSFCWANQLGGRRRLAMFVCFFLLLVVRRIDW